MHSFYSDNGTCFFYNSDLSGDVRIITRPNGDELFVDGMALLEFVAEHVRSVRASQLDELTAEQVLGIAQDE